MSGPPLNVDLLLPEPDRSAYDRLHAQVTRPLTIASRMRVLAEFREEELRYRNACADHEALQRTLPAICDVQQRHLLSGIRDHVADLSLGKLAQWSQCEAITIARAMAGLAVECGGRYVLLDTLVGPRAPGKRSYRLGYADVNDLVPTDLPTQPEFIQAMRGIFREKRQGILDPVIIVADPEEPSRAFVCDGNHRTGAAAAELQLVRVAELRTTEELQAHLIEGKASLLTRSQSLQEFVSSCRARAKEVGTLKYGWQLYLSSLRR